MVLGAITFVVGISGASISIGSVQLKGMAFAAITGVILSLIFWLFSNLGWMNTES
jgi:uracil permease